MNNLIDILDEKGHMIGQKKREDIDRYHDILPAVHVIVITPKKEIVLVGIAQHPDQKRTWIGKLGNSAATFIRHGETDEEAALRALKNDLNISGVDLEILGKKLYTLSEGIRRMVTTFMCEFAGPFTFNPNEVLDLHMFNKEELMKEMSNQQNFAPTFLAMWEDYQNKLPF
ncbi:MAG: hypothetical protein A2V81_03300 [Candidatus Abawacabacteria bacterium RBG_16_42_10]|uniref:Nudix hydrolase domain-containing protein n=1 Tax=Candidatus Abawacabacteria bacterium RBG_16_42_10 TaxID=1817814 RepID=A0A1F4XJR0_9BACT|nr:MAG: hypothetical protein A2V81_03300 [Candidatus Abawacabacteria bacterium RBG_16_42_10]